MKKQINKKFTADTTLKQFVEEITKDGCIEILKIQKTEDGYEASFNIDLPEVKNAN